MASDPGNTQPDPADLKNWMDERTLVDALRSGDERVFMALVEQYHASMLRVAMMYLPDPGIAEEIVQDAWIGVLEGIDRFEGRSSLKTWIFRILTNCAITRQKRESRSLSFSDLEEFEIDPTETSVEPEQFRPPDAPQYPGGWVSFPKPWRTSPDALPEDHLVTRETMRHLQKAVEMLPPAQKIILWLRDIDGWTSEEVCNVFALTETNHRVLLHRARANYLGTE
jgi:RNA polymerase sigma-70 factor (ECF subfamily)